MSLLIIGSSHVGAVKLGLDRIRAHDRSELDVTFFAAPQKLFARFSLNREGRFGALAPSINEKKRERVAAFNGTTAVDLGAFEGILWVGPYFDSHDLIPVLSTYAIDDVHEVDRPFRLSAAAFRQACRAIVAAAYAAMPDIAKGRSNVTILQRPRVVTAEPGKAAARADQWFSRGLSRKTLDGALSAFDDEVEAFLGETGVTLLRQPGSTLAEDGLTKSSFIHDSKTLFGGADQTEHNLNHMNAEYGALCLADYARLKGLAF